MSQNYSINQIKAVANASVVLQNSSTLSLTSFKILLADDDQDDRDIFSEAVTETRLPIDVTCLNGGAKLIEHLSDEKISLPDLIMLDLNMPDKSGIECLDFIRDTIHLKSIPVVIYSTSSSNRDMDITYAKGANLYVCKPASFGGVQQLINKLAHINWQYHTPFGVKQNYLFS
jgi:CheY-like chemotaxis protein